MEGYIFAVLLIVKKMTILQNLADFMYKEYLGFVQPNKERSSYAEALIQYTYSLPKGFSLYTFGFSLSILRQRPDISIIP